MTDSPRRTSLTCTAFIGCSKDVMAQDVVTRFAVGLRSERG